MSNFVKIFVELILLSLRLLRVVTVGVSRLLILILKPLGYVLKFFHFQFFLPVYSFYLLVLKKIGYNKSRRFNLIGAILVNKNFTHILLVFLSATVIFQNIISSKDAVAAETVVGRTPLARLVSDELIDTDQLIEEYQDYSNLTPVPAGARSQYDAVLNPQIAITTNEPAPSMEEDDGLVQEDDALTEDDVTPVADNVAKRTVIIDHVVQAGETASSIAEKFGISVNTILWENGLSTKALIRPGDTLRILPFTGVTYKVKSGDSISLIAKFYEVDQAKIAEANGLSVNQGLKINQLILIPGGRQIVSRGTPAKPTKPTVKPRPALVELNDNEPDAKPVTGAKMNWPTKGHTITQYYSWRHNGVDIANKTGTPIYSAGDGVVVTAQGGYNGGYGNTIVIDHGAGKKTRYGHLSSLKVEAGDSVTKGELIGAMGSTGRSTGPHLHFEIIIGGKRYNPLNYVSY